jgi:hypothetical protein
MVIHDPYLVRLAVDPLERTARASEELLVSLADEADRNRQFGEAGEPVVHGADVIDHLLHVLLYRVYGNNIVLSVFFADLERGLELWRVAPTL